MGFDSKTFLYSILLAGAVLGGAALYSCSGDSGGGGGDDDTKCVMRDVCEDRMRCPELYKYSVDYCTDYFDNAYDRCNTDGYLNCLCDCMGSSCQPEEGDPDPSLLDCQNNCDSVFCRLAGDNG